ncbi:MAG: efflux RND transporter periplasmic adaptor subunit [Acidobacteria bacterium]|nr:efflux RND transporter periplasmic adaptor subunit [Acidobacteriota bacterium]
MRVVKGVFILLLLAAAFGGGYVFRSVKQASAARKGERKVLYWVDPMHPAYKSDKPGIAPDCGMKLEPVYADGGAPGAAQPERKVLYYRDPQAPDHHSDKPGINPETGNTLEPVYAEDTSAMPSGTVQISPEKQQLIGVRYGQAEFAAGGQTVRAAAKVAYDETRVSHVHSRTEGWADRVMVDYTGQYVQKGQPMLTLYSPDLLASQQELLLAAKARDTMKDSPLPGSFHNSELLLEAARRRLELWDLDDAQIEQVLKTRQPVRDVTITAPASGYVLERKVFPQQKIMPEMDLYTYEYEAGEVRVGQPARVSLTSEPGKSFRARVTYIQPQVDPITRTLKVRLEADNPKLLLKPDMYAQVEFEVPGPRVLTVPAEAVLDAGERKTVFVDRGNGFFEPRQVVTGERMGDRIPILKGLSAGERVVTSGNFLIDSESQLKAAAGGMGQ